MEGPYLYDLKYYGLRIWPHDNSYQSMGYSCMYLRYNSQKTERFTPLIRTYERVSLRFYSKDQPYYEVSGSVLILRTKKRTTGYARSTGTGTGVKRSVFYELYRMYIQTHNV